MAQEAGVLTAPVFSIGFYHTLDHTIHHHLAHRIYPETQ
jgi:hypothetical protein